MHRNNILDFLRLLTHDRSLAEDLPENIFALYRFYGYRLNNMSYHLQQIIGER